MRAAATITATITVTIGAVLVAVPVVVAALAAGLLASLTTATLGGGPSAASAAAVTDIPPGYLRLYQQAAGDCPGLDWTVLAAIGKIESDHGRSPLPGVTTGQNAAGAGVICGSSAAGEAREDRGDTPRPGDVSAGCEARRPTVRVMIMKFRAERAVSPSDGAVSWVVIDDASRCTRGVRVPGRAAGAGPVGQHRAALRGPGGAVPVLVRRGGGGLGAGRGWIRWCGSSGGWSPSRCRPAAATGPARRGTGRQGPRTRSLGTVCEFLRFCARHDLVDPDVVNRLHETAICGSCHRATTAGRTRRFRTVRSRMLSFTVAQSPFAFLEPDRSTAVVTAAGNPRDRFLVALVGMTGMRIGEALGLHRRRHAPTRRLPLPGLPDTGPAPARAPPRRQPNGALAKSRFPRRCRSRQGGGLYADYSHERAVRLGGGGNNPLVFINLYRPPPGAGWSYREAKEMFDRLARRTGVTVRPHLLRHTAATTWLRQGTPRDTVQALSGMSPRSRCSPTCTPTPADLRAAVQRGAAAWAGETR